MDGSSDARVKPFRLGGWSVEPSRLRVSWQGGEDRRLTPRGMAVLCTLAATNGEVVAKYDLMDAVWGRAEVSDAVLSQTILELRTALGDDARKPDFIETIRGVGFRLIPAVEPINGDSSQSRTSIAAAAVVVLVVAIALTIFWTRDDNSLSRTDVTRIMVVPFEDRSQDGDFGFFAEAMAEGIRLELAGSSRITPIADSAVRSLRSQGLDVHEIADRLNATLILTGSVQRRPDAIQLIARVIDHVTGEERWAVQWTRSFDDMNATQVVYTMQDDAARDIAELVLHGEELPDQAVPTQNLEAYDLYSKGRAIQRGGLTEQSNAEAKRLFEQAREADPKFALARAALASCWATEGVVFGKGPETLQMALRESELALGIQPDLAEGHAARATALMGLGRFAEARTRAALAVDLAPKDSDIAFISAFLAEVRGDYAASVRDYVRAVELNPLFPRTVALGRVYFLLGDAEAATSIAERGQLLDPGFPTLYLAHLKTLMGEHVVAETLCSQVPPNLPRARNLCGFSAIAAGRDDDARRLLAEDWAQAQIPQTGAFSFAPSATHLALLMDDPAEAERLLQESERVTRELIADGNDYWALRYNLAAIAAQRGEHDIALEWLREAYKEGFRDWALLKIDPALSAIRESDEFEAFAALIEQDLQLAAEKLGMILP